MSEQKEPYKKIFLVLSIIIPVAVAVLFRVKVDGYDLRFLPSIYASINALTAVLLVAAVISIKRGNRTIHERLMKTCIGLSAMFLVLYVLYHITTPSTVYGGDGFIKYVYYFILISHIILSVAITPLVLFTFSRALGGNFVRHKALAKFTFPIWLYVAVSGVVVYLMISPYYS
jgi:putative membrane protein